jgi:CCR4-NOT transcription complex subunit 1
MDEEISSLFFRCSFEASVDNYIKARTSSSASLSFASQAIDSYAKLVVQLLKYYVEPSGADPNVAKLQILTKILSIIVLILGHAHEQQRASFNQKPFFRFFSSFLCELALNEDVLKSIYFRVLVSFR